MKTITRTSCVLCADSHLFSFSKFEHPVYECVPVGIQNESWEIEFGYCENCYSVQLMRLADPEVIYDKNYFQPLNYTHLWIQHNISFTKFIIDNLNTDLDNSITEIGSSSFCLGKHLIHYYKDYTVFDYSLGQAIRRDGVKYIEGNCETYDFKPDTNIIMSHVFEHLYEPKKFINNCSRNGVKNIFISVPSMNDNNQLHIGVQHTFAYSENDIEYIFGLHNYKLSDKIVYNTKDSSFPCLFFHFTLTQEPVMVEREIDVFRHTFSTNLLSQKITVPENTFISTCGMWSIITYALIENKENIIGVIDYNKDKHNKWFSTTNIMVYPYEHLSSYQSSHILVIHPKKKNIVNMIKSVNDKINIILM
jgi:hypothetical protein